jgi:hypothetical protein
MITQPVLDYVEEAVRLGNEALNAATSAQAAVLLELMASALERAKLLMQQHAAHTDPRGPGVQ